MRSIFLAAVLAILYIPVGCIGQSPAFHADPNLESFVQDAMLKADVPGISMAVVSNGEIVYQKAFGIKSTDSKQPVNEETRFEAASLSKPLFGFGVMQLVEEGKLNLDKPLYEYLPYPDAAHDERYKRITARMALSHTTGFPNWRNGDQLNLQYPPGERFRYSGEGFVYLMRVVEKITGKSMEAFMQERVLKPLGMTHSSYVWQTAFDDNFAMPHDDYMRTGSKNKPQEGNAAYSLQTTAGDYIRFVQAILNKKGLKKTTFDEILHPQVALPFDDPKGETLAWGLGWGLQQTAAGTSFWHWGDNGNFKCFVVGFDNAKTGMVVFTNGSPGLTLMPDLFKRCIGGTYPALDWLEYGDYRSVAQTVWKTYQAGTPWKDAIQPYLDKSGLFQDTTQIKEGEMNQLGYRLLNAGDFAAAVQAFALNAKAYPNSANVYDSYGEALLRSGRVMESADQYAKAAALDPGNDNAKALARYANGQYPDGNTAFTLYAYPHARLVTLAGSFNDWNPITLPCWWEEGHWVCKVNLDPGKYEYKFVVDGVWIPDPANGKLSEDANHNSVFNKE